MRIFNIRAEKVPEVLESLKSFGVPPWDVRNRMDFDHAGGATYYAVSYVETAALLSVSGKSQTFIK